MPGALHVYVYFLSLHFITFLRPSTFLFYKEIVFKTLFTPSLESNRITYRLHPSEVCRYRRSEYSYRRKPA